MFMINHYKNSVFINNDPGQTVIKESSFVVIPRTTNKKYFFELSGNSFLNFFTIPSKTSDVAEVAVFKRFLHRF